MGLSTCGKIKAGEVLGLKNGTFELDVTVMQHCQRVNEYSHSEKEYPKGTSFANETISIRYSPEQTFKSILCANIR